MNIDFKKIRELTMEQIAQENDDKNASSMATIEWLAVQIPYWKKLYLKKNQQSNYFRVTKTIPPGMENNPFFWKMTFQIWVKGKLQYNYDITTETFDLFYNQWERRDGKNMAVAVLSPSKA